MKYEKSCGAVIFRRIGGEIHVLLLRHRYGTHWGFPKGHVEEGETEAETALREVREETGLSVCLVNGFREIVVYFPKPNIRKQVVYFVGLSQSDRLVRQESEIAELKWTPLTEAFKLISFENHCRLLEMASSFYKEVCPL